MICEGRDKICGHAIGTEDRPEVSIRVREAVCTRAQVAEPTPDRAAADTLGQGEAAIPSPEVVYTQAQVVDFTAAQVAAFILVPVEGYTRAQVAGCTPGRAVNFTLDRADTCSTGLPSRIS